MRTPRATPTPGPLPLHRGGAGEPMLLLHGFTDTWRAWTAMLPELEPHHDVIAPTLPGHFGGEAFPDGVELSLPGTLDMLERQLDALGVERAHIVGNSLGGWLALELAARGRALSVVGICPAGGWAPKGREERHILNYFRRNELMLRVTPPGLLAFTASRPRLRSAALLELVARPGQVPATAAVRMFEGAQNCSVFSQALALARSGEMFGELAAIPESCPVRIAYGTRDRILRWPAAYEQMREMLPDADWVAMDGLGHLAMWDDPRGVAKTVLEVSRG
jgi:pimeloyl-ACP methyl ester carboxylesterase